MPRTLYHFLACPYCEKTRRALQLKGLAWESYDVPIDDRSAVEAISGQAKVPTLDDDGAVVCDSTAIFAYLEDTYPEPPLYPTGRRDRALAEIMDEYADGPLHDVVGHVRTAVMQEEPNPEAQQDLRRYLEGLDNLLSDGREYFFGTQSLADMSIYAHMRFLLLHPDMPKGDDLRFFSPWVDRMQAQGA